MKRILLPIALLACFAASALAQSTPPIVISEVDGSPTVYGVTKIIVSNGTLTVSGTTATIVTGGGGGGGTPGGSNGNVQFNSVGNFGGVAGFNFNGTSAITLGVAGTSVGSVGFRNATSGTVTLQPVTGALGTVTLSLPARTATVATTTGTLTSGRCAEFDASGNLVQAGAGCLAVAGTTNSLQTNNGGGALDGSATVLADLTTATIILGDLGVQNGRLQLRNSTNSNVTNLISGAPSSSLTFTLPATLPASAGCLEVSSTGVITQTGSACGSGGGSQTPWTSNIDADGFNLLFDDGTGIQSTESGNANLLLFTSVASGVNYFRITNSATATKPVVTLEATGSDTNQSIYLKTASAAYPNMGQVYFNVSGRYDRPAISFAESGSFYSDYGIGLKAGGSWLSLYGQNLKLGTTESGNGLVDMNSTAQLVWHANNSAAEDCPPCADSGFARLNKWVIGVIASPATADNTFPNGGTFGFTATTPAQITSNQDNYDPGTASYFQRWSTDASRNITGLTFASSTKTSGQIHRIWNVGSFNIVLVNEATSTAANQFKTSTGADITLAPKECADVQYDTTQSRWLTTPCATAGAGGGSVTSVATTSPITGGTITTTGTIGCATCTTNASALTSNSVVLGAGSQATKVVAGFTTDGTSILTLGEAGTSVGTVAFKNATSGTINLLPVTGALGTVTLSLPARTATVATTSGALTNGNCAEFDASGNIVDSGGTCGGGGSPGGSSGDYQYNNGGSLGGTNMTYSSPTNTITSNAIGTTPSDGLVLLNTTDAALGAQQYSPGILFTSEGWSTTSSATRVLNWREDLRPVQGTTNPQNRLVWSSQVNGGGYTERVIFGIDQAGIAYTTFPSGLEAGPVGISLGASGSGIWEAGGNTLGVRTASGASGTFAVYAQPTLLSGSCYRFNSNSASIGSGSNDTLICRGGAAATIQLGAADANGASVAQTLRVQNGITGTDVAAAASFNIRGPLGTGNTTPGYISLQGGARNTSSGTTAQTALDRMIVGTTKVLTNNSATAIVNVTAASNTNAGGVIDYCIDVTDGTDVQYECGMATYGVSNKGGVFSGNTVTKFGNHQNATSGTLTVTIAISGANPAVLSVNANSSLTPSTGFPRIVYSLRNNTNQAVAVQ